MPKGQFSDRLHSDGNYIYQDKIRIANINNQTYSFREHEPTLGGAGGGFIYFIIGDLYILGFQYWGYYKKIYF